MPSPTVQKESVYVRDRTLQQKAKNLFLTIGIVLAVSIIVVLLFGFSMAAVYRSLSRAVRTLQYDQPVAANKTAVQGNVNTSAAKNEPKPQQTTTDILVARQKEGLMLLQRGEEFERNNESGNARDLYVSFLDSQSTFSYEEKLLALNRLNRLSGIPLSTNQIISDTYHQERSIKILPLDANLAGLRLSDICAILSSKYLMPCTVLSPLSIGSPETQGTVYQLDAVKIIDSINSSVPESVKQQSYIMAITDTDMKSGDANFSFATAEIETAIGVVSAYRFGLYISQLPEYEALLNRRVVIQMMSTLGQLMGFSRPAGDTCPLAYVDSIEAFVNKTSIFCDDERRQLDQYWLAYGGQGLTRIPEDMFALQQLYGRYFIE